MMYYSGWGSGWAIVCMVTVIAIIALVAWAIVALTNRRDSRDDREASSPDALAVLERRFANGEIDENDYKRRHKLLVANSLPSTDCGDPGAVRRDDDHGA